MDSCTADPTKTIFDIGTTPLSTYTLDEEGLVKSGDCSTIDLGINPQIDSNFACCGKPLHTTQPIAQETAGLHMYRQDCVLSKTDPNTQLYANLDGHGLYGHCYSEAAARRFQHHYEIDKNKLVAKCMDGTIMELLNTWFLETHEYVVSQLPNTCSYNTSGTTATVVLIAQCPVSKKRFIIGANVGDTPAYFKQNDTIFPLFETHSVDSKTEYKRYVLKCQEQGTLPYEFIYNRINVIGGNPHPDPTITGHLPMYNWDPITQTVTTNQDSYAKLIAGFPYPGGIQSIHRDTSEDHKHENWGSTVAGRLQMTRTIGDCSDKEKLYLDCEPSVIVHELDLTTDCTLIIGSDGFFDASKVEESFDIIHHTLTARMGDTGGDGAGGGSLSVVTTTSDSDPYTRTCAALWDKLCSNLHEANESFGCEMFTHLDGVPNHDDISYIIGHIKGSG